ncbi:MAG: sulfotransferase [Verrucomicrobia bacterium]|nr:sulfotransferase [Verrucomicrobiota bacterium]MDA1088271.1 sulfotransferase [Verrucomicrobiota bacterium]
MSDHVSTLPVTLSACTPKLLVVGGIMRGGTSLLREVLNSHPGIALFSCELRAMGWCGFAGGIHVAAVHHYLWRRRARIGNREFRKQAYNYMWRLLRRNGVFDPVELGTLRAVFAQCLASPSTKYVGDKYPQYISHYPKCIHDEDSRCIFIIRDPRDSVSSLYERIQRGHWRQNWTKPYTSVAGAAKYWMETATAIKSVQTLGGNALVIRYEDLVLDPQRTLEMLARHLELPVEGFDAGLPHADSIGKHKQFLTPCQVDEVEQIAGKLMPHFSYE